VKIYNNLAMQIEEASRSGKGQVLDENAREIIDNSIM
jgi:hypothetical protein